jgi:hypothetical protein
MSMDSKSRNDYLVKPALVGASFGIGTVAYYGMDQKYNVGGSQYPLWMLMAGLGVVGSEAMALVNNYLFDHIPVIRTLSHPGHTALAVAGTAGSVLLAEQVISPGLAGDTMYPVIALAAGSEVLSTYLTHEWVAPWLDTDTTNVRLR